MASRAHPPSPGWSPNRARGKGSRHSDTPSPDPCQRRDPAGAPVRASRTGFEIERSTAEWRERLTPAQFAVLRERRTEHAWTNHLGNEASPLLTEHCDGSYNCAGCDLGLYRSEAKYDSRTGWPGFRDTVRGAVLEYDDSSFVIRRIGLMCRRCGGHLGHLFGDGPEPTGLRHCINGLAMTFTPDARGVEEGFPVRR